MNQILLYGGFCLSVVMFLLCLVIWFRFNIRKTWHDVTAYHSQRLGVSRQTRNNYNKTVPLQNTKTNETALLNSNPAGWSILDEVLFIHTNEI